MEFLDICAILLTLAGLFSYVNYRWIKLPTTIGIMLISLIISLLLIGLGEISPWFSSSVSGFVKEIDFNKALMNGMLSYLLFAGALHVNLHELKKQGRIVSIMASVGVVVSTFLIGGSAYYLFEFFNVHIPFVWCLVFGALISPTDPVAVLGILKTVGAPKSLETKITGESLFNDGVGVVVYLALMGIAGVGAHSDAGHGTKDIAMLFLHEAGGGLLIGGVLGFICYCLLKSIDNYHIEVLLTLVLVTAGYRLAMALHMSGPLAMVVAGLMIGNHGREDAMSDKTRIQIDTFWELIDEILNAVLFLLIGLEIFVLDFSPTVLLIGFLLIPISLLTRLIAVWLPISILRRWRVFTPGVTRILTWGGIRGGISVALALAIPISMGEVRDSILLVTYVIVIFSIVVQGLTLKPLVQRIVQ